MKKALCILLLSVLACAFVLPYAALAEGGVPQAVLDLRKSVVRVICRAADGGGSGSGFAIGTEEPIKYVVTNLHVVEENRSGVTILRENNREIKASVYLELEHADLCVLLLDEALYGVPPIRLADGKEAVVGQAVYALGFPGAADDLSDKATGDPEDVTVTDGIVSAVKSLTLTQDGEPVSLLQINAAINHGNSGGPLVDDQANVLGINALGIETAQNVNGAISIRELTGALWERNVVYLSASDGKAGFPLLAVVIAGSALLLAAAALLAVLLVRRAKRAKGKAAPAAQQGVPLPDYLKQWGGRLPYGMAGRVLAPALRALAALHAAGRMHGDICPETISVDPNSVQAALRPPEPNVPGGRLVLRPGFSSPEQYRADGRLGPWSDVYSMCAVFYYAITGAAPQGVMERMAQGGETIDLAQAGIDDAHAAALFAGLALDAANRPQSAPELAAALGVDLTAAAPAVPTIAEPATAAKPVKKRMKTGRKLLIAGAAALFVLCAGTGGYYLYLDSHYNEAVECIRKQDYKGGIDHLTQVLRIFKSCEQWMNYACSGLALQQNDFRGAREGFVQAGEFNSARDMLREVDYLEAYYLLANGDYKRSKSMFATLGEYKESKQMIQETDYQEAMSLINKKEYAKARDLFQSLNDYKRSKEMVMESDYQIACLYMDKSNFLDAIRIFSDLDKKKYRDSDQLLFEASYLRAIQLYDRQQYSDALKEFEKINGYKAAGSYIVNTVNSIYDNSVSFYRNKNYSQAKRGFELISKYINCDNFFTLIEAHSYTDFKLYDWADVDDLDYSYSSLKRVYQKLTSLGPFEDAQVLRVNDIFIYFRLEGTWRNGGYYFQLNHKNDGWTSEYNLPWYKGNYFSIENGIYFTGSASKTTTKQFGFYFISENKMEVYCYKNRRTYTLTR